MITINDIASRLEREIGLAERDGKAEELFALQGVAGMLMKPAAAHDDLETEQHFRILAARAANAREAILKRRDDD